MSYALSAVKMLLVMLSCYGYVRMLSRHIRAEFAPGVLFASICSAMFFAGILNILEETAWCICIGGVCLAVVSVCRRESLRPVLCPGIVAFLLAAVAFLIALHGMILTDYDDFSHWGTVLKVMITNDRFPNYADKVITYQSYPPGSAGFLYYFLTVTGITSEWFQLYVQAIFMAGILVSLFAFVRDGLGWLFAAAVGVILLLCSNGLINLLVDTLLPVAAVGAMSLCFYYRKTLRGMIYWVVPYLISLVAIKNSGILFAVFLLGYVLCYLGREGRRTWIQVCAVPALTLLLWQKHVLLVFDNGLNSRHSMSMESVTGNFLRKGAEDVYTVIRVFLEEVLSWANPAVYLLLLMVALIVLSKGLRLQWTQDSRLLIRFSAAAYLIYEISVLGMYVTTMPYGEAIVLAGYTRYHRTILIFCGACVYLVITDIFAGTVGKRIPAYLLTLLLLYQALFPGLWYNNPKHCGFIREDFEALITQNRVRTEKSYCVVLDSDYAARYSSYLRYLIRYLLDSSEMMVCSIDAYQESDGGWEGYDYLICFGESPEMDDFLRDTFGSVEDRVMTTE